jgi:tetratricopeptide (TPR) repeat protein
MCIYALALLAACATTGGTALSLQDAIEQSAEKIVSELPAGSRVAIVAFESESDNLSNYIMEELTGALFDRGIEVADRRNLPYVFQELNFQMSGMVSDETAVSVGKQIGANMVITGQLINLNGMYRYRTTAIRMEQATHASVTRINVRSNAETRRMIAALARQQTVVTETKYGVSEDRTPQTAGTYLDRGIMFAMRGEYDMAILDFTDAIRLNPNMAAAYILRARALFASVSIVTSVEDNFSSIDTNNNTWSLSAEQERIFDRAFEDLTQAIQLDPDNANAYVERGNVNRNMWYLSLAIEDYTQAIRRDPYNAKTYVKRGYVYSRRNDEQRAIADYTMAIRLDRNLVEAYFRRGDEYLYTGDYDLAIADFTEVIRLNPNNADAYKERGDAYTQKYNYSRAVEDYETVLRIDLNHPSAIGIRNFISNYQQGINITVRRIRFFLPERVRAAPEKTPPKQMLEPAPITPLKGLIPIQPREIIPITPLPRLRDSIPLTPELP